MRLLTWMPRELLEDLGAIDPVLNQTAPTRPDPESILRRIDAAGPPVDTPLDLAGPPSLANVRSRRWLAPVCASVVVVAVVAGVVGYNDRVRTEGGSASRSSSPSATRPAASTDPSQLASTSWELTRIIDPSGKVPSAASAPVIFTFKDGSATDHVGDAATVHITAGRITFGTWVNDLMFHQGPRLDIAQANFVAKLSNGRATWLITGNTLTIALGGGASLVFVQHAFDGSEVYGSISGRFMAVGGPVGVLSPRPLQGIGTVQITNTKTGQTQTVDTGTGGSFATSIAPGTYTVKGTISTYQSGRCAANKQIVVQPKATTTADVYCQER
jgi:hypothetical protein